LINGMGIESEVKRVSPEQIMIDQGNQCIDRSKNNEDEGQVMSWFDFHIKRSVNSKVIKKAAPKPGTAFNIKKRSFYKGVYSSSMTLFPVAPT
jgi:hypothetical protein